MISPILYEDFSDVVIRPCAPDQSRPPWCRDHTYQSFDPMKVLGRELIDFGEWIQLTKEEKAMRSVVVKRFTTAIKQICPNYKVCNYGSSACNTSLYNGDVDMCIFPFTDAGTLIDIPGSYNTMCDLKNELEKYNLWDAVKVIDAHVPIIKGIDKCYNLEFDISFNCPDSAISTERNIKTLENYPAIFPVLMLLKLILKRKNMIGVFEGGISSCMLFNLVLFIVQMTPPQHKNNPAMILMSFLATFGGTFNFKENIVCTSNGGRVKRKLLSPYQTDVQICIEDPQDHGRILTGKYIKHREIIEYFTKLKNKLTKPYVPFESFIGRLVDISYANNIENERIKLLNKFTGRITPKPERKMSWAEMSRFVIAQCEEIRTKKQKPEEDEPLVFWQNSFLKQANRPKPIENTQSRNEMKSRQRSIGKEKPAFAKEKKQIQDEKDSIMKMISKDIEIKK